MAKTGGGGGRGGGGGAPVIKVGSFGGSPTYSYASLLHGDLSKVRIEGADVSKSTLNPGTMLAAYKKKYGTISASAVDNLVRAMKRDHAVRSKGRLMTSKYKGKDAATGQPFKAGTKIYYASGLGAVIASRD